MDSGASVSIFSLQGAEAIGVNYHKGEKLTVAVGDGDSIPVYLHKLRIRIGTVSLRVTIGFSPRLGVGFNLLGRRDIFRHFDITFSDSKKTVTFCHLRQK